MAMAAQAVRPVPPILNGAYDTGLSAKDVA